MLKCLPVMLFSTILKRTVSIMHLKLPIMPEIALKSKKYFNLKSGPSCGKVDKISLDHQDQHPYFLRVLYLVLSIMDIRRKADWTFELIIRKSRNGWSLVAEDVLYAVAQWWGDNVEGCGVDGAGEGCDWILVSLCQMYCSDKEGWWVWPVALVQPSTFSWRFCSGLHIMLCSSKYPVC